MMASAIEDLQPSRNRARTGQKVCSVLVEGQGAPFRRALLGWYDVNKRDLPWRGVSDPYRIWLSEIMLQQTRVAAVVEYYRRFLQLFPTVESLAAARLPSVLAAWSGLGYYRRARALHTAARVVVAQHDSKFPQDHEAVLQLPGIGRYTAAAILSIAFGRPEAVVDGNVRRVLERLTGQNNLPALKSWEIAGNLLDTQRPGDFNQAMMELGATVCAPKAPLCNECPVIRWCATRGAGHKKVKSARKRATIYCQLAIRDQSVLLVRRSARSSLMPGMWELPSIKPRRGRKAWLTFRHSITVTDFRIRVWQNPNVNGISGRWIAREKVAGLPLTGLRRKILRAAKFI